MFHLFEELCTMLTIILASVIAGILLLFIFKGKSKAPPGPFALPILGHALFIGTNPALKYMEWSKKYGKIIQVRMGPIMTVNVIDDPVLAKEAFNNLAFTGIADLEIFKEWNGGKYGILFNEGAAWQEQRRFTMSHLREFGLGKKAVMESKILEDVKELMEGFKKEENKAIVVEKKFNVAVLNSLWTIMTGQHYSHDDPQVTLLMDNFKTGIEKLFGRFVVVFLPRVAKMIPGLSGWGYFTKVLRDLHDFFNYLVTEHKKDWQENNPRDFIDAYLDEINKTDNPNSSFYKKEGEKSLPAVVFDVFQAGFGAVSFALNWAVLYLSTHPDVQKRFQAEIDSIIGKSRLPSLDDKSKMPYTESLIMEILRKSAIVGITPSHKALTDVSLHGYEIKKGTLICANVYSIHHNPEIWGDPENFRPERFLDKQGNCVKTHDALMPFSVGKKACIGENFAKDEIFLFLASIFQRFTIKYDRNSPKPSLEPKWIGGLVPQEYKVVISDRV